MRYVSNDSWAQLVLWILLPDLSRNSYEAYQPPHIYTQKNPHHPDLFRIDYLYNGCKLTFIHMNAALSGHLSAVSTQVPLAHLKGCSVGHVWSAPLGGARPSTQVVDPAVEVWSGGHGSQKVDPRTLLKKAAGHLLPSLPYCYHIVTASLPSYRACMYTVQRVHCQIFKILSNRSWRDDYPTVYVRILTLTNVHVAYGLTESFSVVSWRA